MIFTAWEVKCLDNALGTNTPQEEGMVIQMDGTQLGKKLKEARLAKKMTQSDVVGTFITRNMLSQIESGAAFPSLRTLEYLANTLELPIHFLIPDGMSSSDESDSAGFEPAETEPPSAPDIFMKCKNAFLRGDYAYVTEQASELNNSNYFYYDEGVALLARAYLKSAKRFQNESNPKSAVANARYAAEFGGKGIYASREVRTEALLLLDELSEKMGR